MVVTAVNQNLLRMSLAVPAVNQSPNMDYFVLIFSINITLYNHLILMNKNNTNSNNNRDNNDAYNINNIDVSFCYDLAVVALGG